MQRVGEGGTWGNPRFEALAASKWTPQTSTIPVSAAQGTRTEHVRGPLRRLPSAADEVSLTVRIESLTICAEVELVRRLESGKSPHFGYTAVSHRRVRGRGWGAPSVVSKHI